MPEVLWSWLERTPPETFELTERQYKHRRTEALKRAGLLIEADDIKRENRNRKKSGQPPLELEPKLCRKTVFGTAS